MDTTKHDKLDTSILRETTALHDAMLFEEEISKLDITEEMNARYPNRQPVRQTRQLQPLGKFINEDLTQQLTRNYRKEGLYSKVA